MLQLSGNLNTKKMVSCSKQSGKLLNSSYSQNNNHKKRKGSHEKLETLLGIPNVVYSLWFITHGDTAIELI